MSNNNKTFKLTIIGKVQGVGFRYWFSKEAIALNLKGYVKNLKNENEVESIVQGHANNISHFIEKCKHGPKLAMVEKIISKNINDYKVCTNFKIQ